jgi:hypothetical protein
MSVAAWTPVLVAIDGKQQSIRIGELIDQYLTPATANQNHIVPVNDLQCVGVSPTETVQWADVTHVSRHPANGDMVTITTEKGRSVRATASHSFLVRVDNRVIARPGRDLLVGNSVPVIKDMAAYTDCTAPPAVSDSIDEAHIPGLNSVITQLRSCVPISEVIIHKELARISHRDITPDILMRCRNNALQFGASQCLLDEFDQAINADVWWDRIIDIQIDLDSQEMVYDFTVDKRLQSFMLTNGIFVHNTLNT